MKKIIPFTKDIKFNTKIYEITSISLENSLTIEENNVIDGEFILSGEYKINDTSLNIEPFIYGLPFNITIDDYYDTDKLKVDIDDFKFEIVNEEILRVNIDVLLEGTIKLENKEDIKEENNILPDIIIKDIEKEENIKTEEDNRGKEDNKMNDNQDLFKQNDIEAQKVDLQVNENKTISVFDNFDDSDEKFVSYYVYIVRDNDNIETISKKYNIDINVLKEYNDLDNITLGSKIIIPYLIDDTI